MGIWFADGLEDGFNPWTATEVNNVGGGDISTSSGPAYAGTYAAIVNLIDPVLNDYARAYKLGLNIAVGSYIFSSAQWYFPSATFNLTDWLYIMKLQESPSPYGGIIVAVNASKQLYIYDTVNSASYTQASPISLPLDQYVGIELEIYAHQSAGYIKLRQDGDVIIEQTGIDTQPTGNYDRIFCGAYMSADQVNDLIYYFDKVSVQDGQSLYVHRPTGGITFGGSAKCSRTFCHTPSGGITFGGSAPASRTFCHTPSGGIVFGGSAPASRTFLHTPRGGIVFGGSAECIWPQRPRRPRAVVKMKRLRARVEVKRLHATLKRR